MSKQLEKSKKKPVTAEERKKLNEELRDTFRKMERMREEEFLPVGCIVYATIKDDAIEKAKEAFEAIKGAIDDFPDVRDIGRECFVSANSKVGREFAKDCLIMSAFGPLLFDYQGMPITCGRELTWARTGYRQTYKKLGLKSPHEDKKVWIISAQMEKVRK